MNNGNKFCFSFGCRVGLNEAAQVAGSRTKDRALASCKAFPESGASMRVQSLYLGI